MTILLWVSETALRLDDLPALAAAAATGQPIIPVFVLDEEDGDPFTLGGASRWWLGDSLESLAAGYRALGSRLILRRGDTVEELLDCAQQAGATALYTNRAYDPRGRAREAALHKAFEAQGLAVKRFGGHLLHEPGDVKTGAGKPYTVYSPFWRACEKQPAPKRPQSAPDSLRAPDTWPHSLPSVADLDLGPKPVDWAGGLREAWQPGEAGATALVDAFFGSSRAGRYKTDRNKPGHPGTSGLSAHLRFGEISIRRLFHRARDEMAAQPSAEAGLYHFTKELGWREFGYHLLFFFPHVKSEPLRPAFLHFPWTERGETAEQQGESDLLAAWQRGETGYPIVDAGMKQLWHTGWMHNRVRMIVASFLVKDLLWHWRDGEAWFWDCLVDADPASNIAGWQWAAGCGADAAPYFRIFNPILQGEKFDPDGSYVKKWLPALEHMPARFIHKPWEAPELVLKEAGVALGDTYPRPMVDRAEARQRALDAFQTMKTEHEAAMPIPDGDAATEPGTQAEVAEAAE